jgi:hypothetical protein
MPKLDDAFKIEAKGSTIDQEMAPKDPCPAIPVDALTRVPIGMDSMLTTAAVSVPPVDGFIEGPTWSYYMRESMAALSASSRIQRKRMGGT